MQRLAGTLKRSLARGVLIVGLVAAVPALLFGAPPYSQNTSGTTIDGVLSALTDIYNRLVPPTVLSAPQSYNAGENHPAGMDAQGGLIPATGLRTASVTCSASCATFGTGSAGILFTISTWPYSTIDVDVTSPGVGTTITYEVSNDNPTACASSTTWTGVSGIQSSTTAASESAISSAAGMFSFPTVSACFRVRVSGYGSGTVTAGAYQTNNQTRSKAASVNGIGQNSTPLGALQGVTINPNPYASGAIAITAVGTGTTGAVTATLAAVANKFTYLCSIDISAIGGTATIGPITITNLMGNTFTYQLGSLASGNTFSKTFSPCIPTNATNTAIVATTTADGTASAVDINMSGFQL